MHIHTVFFWLWRTAGEGERAAFREGLDSLTSDPNVLSRRIGTPADTARPVIDSSYDFAIVLEFASRETHDAYQAGPAHQGFLRDCERLWSRVQVYDIEVPG